MFGGVKKDRSIGMTVPKTRILHGVAVKKLPIGKYIQVLRAAEDLPALLVGEIFPDAKNASELIGRIVTSDKDTIVDLIGRLLTVVPEQFCALVSELLDIPKERLLDVDYPDPLSLNELIEVIIAFVEVNDYSDFFGNVRLLKQTVSAQKQSTQNTGSSAG